MKGSESIQEQSCCRRRRCDRRCGKSSSQIWTSPALGSVSDAPRMLWESSMKPENWLSQGVTTCLSAPDCEARLLVFPRWIHLSAKSRLAISGSITWQVEAIGSQEKPQYCQRVEWQQLRMLPQSSWLMPWLAHPRHPSCAWSTTLICSCL